MRKSTPRKVGNAAGKRSNANNGKAKRMSPVNRGSSSRYARNSTKRAVIN